jgi:hypothetical protein
MSIQKFDPIAVGSDSTVVAEYSQKDRKAAAYQSEADLENRPTNTLPLPKKKTLRPTFGCSYRN